MVSESVKSTGVTLPYEKQAMNGEEMPDGLAWPDQVLYLQLRMLYDQFRKGIIDKKTARSEKMQFLDSYRVHTFLTEVQEDTNMMWARIDLAVVEYRKNPSIEHADAIIDAMYRTGRHGVWQKK